MKSILGKKQVLLAVLVVALGVAVYLNYYFSANDLKTAGASVSATSSKNLGDAKYVNNPTTVSGSVVNTSDYFVQARLNRDTDRKEALAVVNEVINNVKVNSDAQKEAAKSVAAIAEAINQESSIESLIKAKGFSDCIVYINGENCNVVVRTASLTDAQALQIKDIVVAQSNVVAQKVNIVTVK